MRVFENLEPKNVFYWFEEICKIPHGSGNIDMISDFLVDFAISRHLEVVQDDVKNVIIKKPATPGCENGKPVILQGHMDMVAVQDPDCDLDMEREGLRIAVDGDYVYAKGTSLGGDDGIAVAYALAILDSDTVKHPALEVLITVNEETGMDGAIGVDMDQFAATNLINLDSEEEGILWAGCAGGMRVGAYLPIEKKHIIGEEIVITITGLLGGHSGGEIHKERANANVLMGRVLSQVASVSEFCLIALEGGLKDNAIAIEATARVVAADGAAFVKKLREIEKDLQHEYATKDPGLRIDVQSGEFIEWEGLNAKESKKIANLIMALPYGVQAMSADVPGLVETSLNLGIMRLEDKEMHLEYSLRSSIKSSKYALCDKIVAIVEGFGGRTVQGSEYPAWEFRKDSPLRNAMVKVYREMYHKEPEVAAIHAGLECGLFSEKKPELDCVSIGPNMKDIHTTAEKLSISSVESMWKYLLACLEELGK